MLGKLAAAAACAGLLATAAVPPSTAVAQGAGIRVGYLTCQTARGVGFVFGMTRQIECTYAPSSGEHERYTGQIQQFGVNLGFIDRGVIMWAVVAPTANIARGSLAGGYGGVAAGVALGYGLGANALFGGGNGQIGLQPLSIEGQQGLNIAAGIAGISLRAVPPARPAQRR